MYVCSLYITYYYSELVERFGPLCKCVSTVQTVTFTQNDLWSRYLTCWFILTLSSSSSMVKIIGHFMVTGGKKFTGGKTFALHAHYKISAKSKPEFV